MSEGRSDEPGGPSARRRELIFVGAILIGFILFFEALTWFGHGGLPSIISALFAADAKVSAIDVDSNGLRFSIMAALGLVVLGLIGLFDIDLSKRRRQTIVLAFVIGGAFVLDGFFGSSVIARYMTAHGYSRCPSRDHEAGQGKGRIWFEDYVLNRGSCPAGE